MAPLSRRKLVQAAAAAALLPSAKTVRRTRPGSPNDELRAAVVGVRSRGKDHVSGLQSITGVDVVALVDVDAEVLARRKAELEKDKREREGWAGGAVSAHADLREVLDRDDVDLVAIATPNHLHALQAIWACQAGKDVYVEKPVCHNVFEGRQLVRAAEKYGRVVQAGTQSRSSHGIAQGIAWIRAGNLGAIRHAHGTCFKPRKSIGKVAGPTPVPGHVDWNLYCGPAPAGPLMRSQLHYDWHWQFVTGNGDLGNQGIHQVDTCRWGIGASGLAPAVTSFGGRFGYDDDGDTPNTQVVLLAYEPAPILFEVRGLPRDRAAQAEDWSGRMDAVNGWSIGSTIVCDGGRLVIPNTNDRALAFDGEGAEIRRWEGSRSHFEDFVAAVRARDAALLSAPIAEGHVSSSLCHLGNVSYLAGAERSPDETREILGGRALAGPAFERFVEHLERNGVDLARRAARLGPTLRFDPAGERFLGDSDAANAANHLLSREYREPFVVPREV